MIDLDAFLPQINPKAPACPAPAAYIAILQAAREICERTKLWRYSGEMVIASLDDIALTPPDGSLVMDFESVLFRVGDNGDVELEAKTVDWMDKCMRGWRRGSIEGYPRFFTQTNMGTLRIAPVETGILTVNCYLKPAMDADQLPDFLFQQYGEVVAWGALGRILSTPDQPFTDFNTGAGYLSLFENKVASLAFKGTSGQQRARVRSRGKYS